MVWGVVWCRVDAMGEDPRCHGCKYDLGMIGVDDATRANDVCTCRVGQAGGTAHLEEMVDQAGVDVLTTQPRVAVRGTHLVNPQPIQGYINTTQSESRRAPG